MHNEVGTCAEILPNIIRTLLALKHEVKIDFTK